MMTDNTQNIEQDYRRVVDEVGDTHFLPGTSIEIVRDPHLAHPPQHALFDFDGTLSLIREGWPDVMVPMMVEILRDTGTSESDEELREITDGFVMELTGKQTIYQMIRLAEEVTKRDGQPKPPGEYKHLYHDRLMARIRSRHDNLRTGNVPAEDMLVPGSNELLAGIAAKGVILYLASGTDEQYVREEVELLGLTSYFGEHIYGAVEDYKSFSKAQVIQRILEGNHLDPTRLIGFGDGYVEIQNIKAVGGTAVAVASDESERSGKPDKWKRHRLLGVGADIVVPDFREHDELIDYLWG